MIDVTRIAALEQHLGLAADPALAALRGQLAAATSATVSAATEAYRAKLVEMLGGEAAARARFAAVATKPLEQLQPLATQVAPLVQQAIAARRDLDGAVRIGPAVAELAATPAAVAGGRIIALLPIDSLGLEFDAGALRAAGSGYLREREAGGVLAGDLGAVKVTVAAILTFDDPLSVFALLRAEFRPTGIQLGLGFSLDAVGGIVGVNRRADIDEIRRRLGDGSATEALFGGSTSASGIRTTLTALTAMFPAAPGHVVVGPTFRIGWLNTAGSSLVKLDVGVILVLPEASVLLPGRAVLEVAGPGAPLVHLRADMLGVVDVPAKRITVDAVLVDSQVLGVFRIGGTAAAFLAWGDQPASVLTVGGFFPGFDPAPAQIPPQKRISLALSSPLPGLRLSAEGYAAATAGTLQFGGSLTAGYDIEIAAIRGTVHGDALIQLSPLYAEIRVGGKVAIEALGQELLSVGCHGRIVGPGPLLLTLTATATILWTDVGGTAHFPLSESGGADLSPADLVVDTVRRELDSASNAIPEAGEDPHVVRRRPVVPPELPLAAPFGGLVWRQDRFPLGSPIEKADGRRLVAPAMITIAPPAGAGVHEESLATAMYLDLTTDEALSLGPYQRHHVGYRMPVVMRSSPTAVTTTSDFVELRLPDIPPLFLPLTKMTTTMAVSAAMKAAAGAPALLATDAAPTTTLSEPTWVIADDAGMTANGRDGPRESSPAVAMSLAHADPALTAMPSAAFAGVGL